MKSRGLILFLLLALLVSLSTTVKANPIPAPNPTALVYVNITSASDLTSFASTRLPLFSMLDMGLLTGADLEGRAALQQAGLSFQELDANLSAGSYFIARSYPGAAKVDFGAYGLVLLKTSAGDLLKLELSRAKALTQAGVELRRITLDPKPLPKIGSTDGEVEQIVPDPLIQGMLDQVTETQVYTYDKQLVGELPVWVDGDWYTIPTRETYSGTPIQKATSFVGQHMAGLGMQVDYDVWNNETNPNVVGQITGLVNPDDIYIIGGHLDAVSTTPGADDNASGSVATLIAADILSQYRWGCTLRFAFWTGEEQWMLGSEHYAQEAYNAGENILGYVNLDMIAWNTIGSSPDIELEYQPGIPESLLLADLFTEVVDAYGLNLLPTINPNSGRGSDQAPFWDYGYSAILAIEDWVDFNPYYHQAGDTPENTDPAFFTDFVKAGIGTFAHLNECLIPSGIGSLDGHVTAANDGAPIVGAEVSAEDSWGHSFPANTGFTGYYTRTLLADTYTVTASAYSFLPSTIYGITITTDTITTQDFSLVSAPTHTVSGIISESGTGLPLLATISFDGAPVTVYSDPSTGFYQAVVAEGSYTMHVTAASHRPQERQIEVMADQTQDFALELLPCVLLVDDDQDDPDVRAAYTAVLDYLSVDYAVWDTLTSGDPYVDDLTGYPKLLWYTGSPWSDTFTSADETAVASYLDGGGNFFLSSQDYLYEMHLTPFGQNYLHIGLYDNDVSQATVTGEYVFGGLGPFTLSYPYTNYSDLVEPDPQALVAFEGDQGNAAISYDGPGFRTVFFGFPLEAIPQENRPVVVETLLGFFDTCTPLTGVLDGHVTDAVTGEPLAGVPVNAVLVPNTYQAITDPYGYYAMTLLAGNYSVTATAPGYDDQTQVATVIAGGTTTLDFAMQPTCQPISWVNFDWLPLYPSVGELVTFTGLIGDGSEPVTFTWDFGDGAIGNGQQVAHSYSEEGMYEVILTAANSCSMSSTTQTISIYEPVSGAEFTWAPPDPSVGEMVNFFGSVAAGSEPITYEWAFGDGASGSGQNVTHSYSAEGDYVVTFTATNVLGQSVAQHTISVKLPQKMFFLPVINK